ncbi:MAG: hypothetical protein Q7T48_09100, partial [Cellvibrio sp.]|nr:hypothetical protein [Cellvibrio sp.]
MTATSQQLPSESLLDQIADALAGAGFIILDQPLPMSLINGLIDNLRTQQAEFKLAGVGRQGDYQRNQD